MNIGKIIKKYRFLYSNVLKLKSMLISNLYIIYSKYLTKFTKKINLKV